MCIRDRDIRDVLLFFQKLKADAKEQISELHLDGEKNLTPVSYTHLDVYKRQTMH